MKRFLCLALALCLMLSMPCFSSGALAEDDVQEYHVFSLKFTTAIQSGDFKVDWLASSSNRAVLSCVLYLDMLNSDIEAENNIDLSKASFVVKTDESLDVFGWNEDFTYVVRICYYQSSEFEYGAYTLYAAKGISTSYSADLALEKLISSNFDTYYKNDVSDILSAIQLLTAIGT